MGKANGKTFNCIQKTLGCFWKTNKRQKMKPIVIIMCLLLFGCFGTELIRISGIGIKTGDLITVPHKIETLNKDKNGS
jgi:hypothetical protein